MKISELISQHILSLLDEADGIAEIQRNDLAVSMGCVPSQINYVLTSRFTPERGFIVESRRGGGGYIRITRIQMNRAEALAHAIRSIGDAVSPASAQGFLTLMMQEGMLDREQAALIAAACSDRAYKNVPQHERDILRASILKNTLLVLL